MPASHACRQRRRRPALACFTVLCILLAQLQTAPARATGLSLPALAPTDTATALEGRWPLNDQANPTADTSGNARHGALSGSPVFTSDTPTSLGGAALDFDGVNDAITVSGPESAFDLNVMTVAVWINVDAFTTGYQAIITKGDSAWRLQRSENTDQIHFATNGLSNLTLDSTISLNDNQWHHIVAVYDGSAKYLYIDGSLNASTPATGTISTNDLPLTIGKNGQFNSRFFDGQMDDIRVYSRALTAADVAELYAYTNSAPTAADDTYVTGEETALAVAAPGVLSNDSDPDSDVLTATLLTAPAHGALQFNANGSFVYTPTLTFTGVDTFTYAASDAALAATDAATVTLTVSPPATVSGRVTDAGHGWGLYARIDVAGGEIPPVFTDPATGAYTVTLLQNTPYTVTVTALIPGYTSATYGFTASGGSSTQNFALTATAACIAPGYGYQDVFFENFEGSDGGFTVAGTSTSWAWGTPTSGPGSAFSGVGVWATNLAGNYGLDERGAITSPAIDLSAHAGQALILHWQQWLNTEAAYDFATVDVSRDNGATWSSVYAEVSGSVNLAWALRQITLPPDYAVAGFRVRFRLQSDYSVVRPGWYIDDLGISVGAGSVITAYSQDFDTDDGGYVAAGTASSWAHGAPAATPGPGGPRSAPNAWATNLSGDYNASENSTLTSPAIDLSGRSGAPTLVWNQWLVLDDADNGSDTANIQVSKDGGTNWTQVYGVVRGPINDTGWTEKRLTLDSSYNVSTFRIRFRLSTSATIHFPGWYVDDVSVQYLPALSMSCGPEVGGLVVGNVYDANTQIGLNGAVISGRGIGAVSAATAADPNVDDGFYALFAPAGTVELTASLALYTPDQESVSVTNATTIRRDFQLGAALLAAQPAATTVVLAQGQVATRTVTLANTGTADASVALLEYTGSSLTGLSSAPAPAMHAGASLPDMIGTPAPVPDTQPAQDNKAQAGAQDAVAITLGGQQVQVQTGAQAAAPITLGGQPAIPAASSSRAGAAPFPSGWHTVAPLPLGVARTTVQLAGGQIYVLGGESANGQRLGKVQRYTPATDTWIDTLPAMPLPASNTCSGALGSDMYVVGGSTGSGGAATNLNAVQIFHTATLTWTTAISDPLPGIRVGPACAVHAGKLYVFGGMDGANTPQTTAWVYTPDAAVGGRWASVAPMPVGMVFAAAAVINGKIYVGGGQMTTSTNPATMYVYDLALNTWSSMTGLQTGRGEVAMWQDGARLYVGAGGVGTYLPTVEDYDTTRGLTATWGFSNPLATGRQSPGWVTDLDSQRFYAIGGYNGALLTTVEVLDLPRDVLWLSETPTSGTIAAQSSLPIALRFDSTGLALGAYDAQVVAQVASSPYTSASPVINARLMVVDAAVEAGPASITLSGTPGSIVSHTLTLTNSGTYTDSFDLVLGAHQWNTTLSQSTVGPLGPGQAATVSVMMTVPATALAGAQDAVSVTAVSQIDGTASASATRATTASAIYGVQTTPLASAASGAPGAVVTYTLTVHNTGNTTDTFTLAVTGATWATTLSRSSIALAPAASGTVVVSVTIPANATSGATTSATVTATSQGSAAQTATATVTTTAGQRRLFLPLITRN